MLATHAGASKAAHPLGCIALCVLAGCSAPSDPVVGQWYGKIEDPPTRAKQIVESQQFEEETPSLNVIIAMLDEARYSLKLAQDGTGTLDNVFCRWRREGNEIVIDVGSSSDVPDRITLAEEGRYLRGEGYLFAPWP